MNIKIKILIGFAIVIIISIITISVIWSFFIVRNFHSKNNMKIKSTLESKKEQLFSKIEEMSTKREIQVFIKKGTSEEDIEELMSKISNIDGVSSANIYTKQDALNDLKVKWKDNEELLTIYEGEKNIFPDSIIIGIDDFSKADNIKDIISEFENVENININFKTIQNIKENIDSFTEEELDALIKKIDDIYQE